MHITYHIMHAYVYPTKGRGSYQYSCRVLLPQYMYTAVGTFSVHVRSTNLSRLFAGHLREQCRVPTHLPTQRLHTLRLELLQTNNQTNLINQRPCTANEYQQGTRKAEGRGRAEKAGGIHCYMGKPGTANEPTHPPSKRAVGGASKGFKETH